jgi:alkylated DNA repair dioxygenase AlkB
MSAIYIPNFVSVERAAEMFNELWNGLNWERRSDAPRREYWTNIFGRDYSYGRGAGLRTYHSQDSHNVIDECTLALMNHAAVLVDFEGCFLNGYEGAHDWLGWHEDDDPGIDHTKPIAIVTLYGGEGSSKPRSIQFREKLGEVDGKMTYGPVVDQPLEQGSLCLMPAGFQSTHQHRIPKAGFQSKSRISLTFRSLLG